MPTRTASCHCGQLRIVVNAEPRIVGLCHCLACQQRTGSVFAALAGFPGPYQVFGKATEYVRAGDQGAKFRFRFCPVCGTNLFHTEEGVSRDSVSVAVGAFADPNFPPPKFSIYDCRRHPWVQLPPGTTAFEKDPE
ncbi:GFA family protein [Usitatibacter palustris]|nr:GFA family protein [Usitatibacter palustris]